MQMPTVQELPPDTRVFLNHIYELKKGVRQMALHTLARKDMSFALNRLEKNGIDYLVQEVDTHKVNVFFGKKACIRAISCIVNRPLYMLTPEEDFMLGALLGYDICMQCDRFCERKERSHQNKSSHVISIS